MKTLDCGCQVSAIDGFRYKCCDEHTTRNPCFQYWSPEAQERGRERARKAQAAKATVSGPEEKEKGIVGVDEDPETGAPLEEEDEPGLGNDFDWTGGD